MYRRLLFDASFFFASFLYLPSLPPFLHIAPVAQLHPFHSIFLVSLLWFLSSFATPLPFGAVDSACSCLHNGILVTAQGRCRTPWFARAAGHWHCPLSGLLATCQESSGKPSQRRQSSSLDHARTLRSGSCRWSTSMGWQLWMQEQTCSGCRSSRRRSSRIADGQTRSPRGTCLQSC